jgi:type VI secretion system protein ImpE
MGARELLQAGQLPAAVEAAIQDVKSAPGDVSARIFLFELLSASGQFERARKHLDVVLEKAPAMQEGSLSYAGVLDAELFRARIFGAGDGGPQQMTRTPVTVEPQMLALRSMLAGDEAAAKDLLDQAEAARPARPGAIDGVPFEDIRNADDLLASFLEVIAQGRYGWIPFVQLKKITLDEPKFFRDLLWRPAAIELLDGSSSKMFLPVRYPGSENDPDDQLRLGRSTDWRESGAGVVRGLGQQAFLVGDGISYLLEITEILFT